MKSVYESLADKKLSVVVPVFNEAKGIKDNLSLLISEVEPYFKDFEILVVSDGSTDGTNEALAKIDHPHVKPFLFSENHGKGFVVREGFKHAKGDYLLFIDGGMELHPKEIRIFLGLMDLYQADIVIGSKRHPQSEIEYPMIRRILSFGYQMLIKRLFDLDVTDTQVGLKLFRRAVIDQILPSLSIDRYGFDLEILALARFHGFKKVLEAPVRLDYFSYTSRSSFKEFWHVAKITWLVFKDTFKLYRKLHHSGAVR